MELQIERVGVNGCLHGKRKLTILEMAFLRSNNDLHNGKGCKHLCTHKGKGQALFHQSHQSINRKAKGTPTINVTYEVPKPSENQLVRRGQKQRRLTQFF